MVARLADTAAVCCCDTAACAREAIESIAWASARTVVEAALARSIVDRA